MTKSFRLISLFCIVLLSASCSSKLVVPTSVKPALVNIDSTMKQFNMQIDFKKQSFTGILIVHRRADCEIRIVASTYFGPTLFDFGLKDGELIVYNIIEPMQNKNLVKLFKNDFKNLFLVNRKFRKIKKYPDYTEKVSGRNFGKTKLHLYNSDKIIIKHPWIGINITLENL